MPMLPLIEITANPETGEWLTIEDRGDTVDEDHWNAAEGYVAIHCDTHECVLDEDGRPLLKEREVGFDGLAEALATHTAAIRVRWVD